MTLRNDYEKKTCNNILNISKDKTILASISYNLKFLKKKLCKIFSNLFSLISKLFQLDILNI